MIRVATLNTWGMRGDWKSRRRVFQEGFGELDADIVTWQETILTGEADQAAEMLGPEYHLAQQRDREQDGQGITTRKTGLVLIAVGAWLATSQRSRVSRSVRVSGKTAGR